ncbi:hypothetical protein DYB36_000916 [Aphanomyces astaci]|uniref:Cysteine-rich PDZ-binding protein n=1 Tax=Aphanomyces astaci TaxID=112090 RepID=A0A397AEP5_APHAT|nr:hypothetical protein DYB36_000916 [Aphanomyces astaci]
MVCDKCEAKLSKVIVPDRWKDGARNTAGGKDGGRKISGNALLGKKHRFTPMSRSCRICKTKVAQEAHYCQNCSYTKGTMVVFGTLFDHLEQKNLEPTPLDSLSDDGDDADKDNDADDHLHQQVVYTTNLHLKALPRHGNRPRRMIMSTPTKRVSKAKPKGPRTYDELEALMKSLTTPRSAVYRHAAHMTDVAALGVRIYNVNDHPREATDRIVVARRLSATPSTPHNKAKHNSGRQYVNQAQPRLMKNQKYIERENEFL